MCGIVGYVGSGETKEVLIEGLERLEYRGYDSAGIALTDSDQKTRVCKCSGRLDNLKSIALQSKLSGRLGIGHTRWATHGEPSRKNAHPHTNSDGRIAVVHNGIIENYLELRRELADKKHTFRSETDSEVIPHLIEEELKSSENFPDALRKSIARLEGAYALGIISADNPETVYAVRNGSPLIIGISAEKEYFMASDVPAILDRVSEVIYLNNGEIASLNPKTGISIQGSDGTPIKPKIEKIATKSERIEKAGFETFMLKEIHEQPRMIRKLLQKHISESGEIKLPEISWDKSFFKNLKRIVIVSCGTAYYASMYGRLLLENLTGIAVETDLGSEFRYRNPRIDPETLIMAVSQSGETADTLASVRLAREMGCKILSICNLPNTTLERESDVTIHTDAGVEIGVASTKAYTTQQTVFAIMAIFIGSLRKDISPRKRRQLIRGLWRIPDAIHYVLDNTPEIRAIAEKHHDGPSSLYLGRKYNYPTALEGALKNKEISYQHAEGYAGGEMKHGPIALINEYLPVICICTKTEDNVARKMLSNIKEVEARNGRIIALITENDELGMKIKGDLIEIPEILDELSPIVNISALQILAYYAAQARGTDIDKPRNLAKSVTVE